MLGGGRSRYTQGMKSGGANPVGARATRGVCASCKQAETAKAQQGAEGGDGGRRAGGGGAAGWDGMGMGGWDGMGWIFTKNGTGRTA